jgi:hypothetical protein
MSKIRNSRGSTAAVAALAATFAAALAGCASKTSGDGSESHFLCHADTDCASRGDNFRCEATRCVSAALDSDASIPGSGGATSNGGAGPTSGGGADPIDTGVLGQGGIATNGTGGFAPASSGGSAGAGLAYSGCQGACCPADAACYSSPAGKNSPGAECLATQDNTGHEHIQLRQQWTRATTPAGVTTPLVYSVWSGRSELPWKACNQTGVLGSGGFIELADYYFGGTDKNGHYATTGYASFVPGPGPGVDPATFAPTAVLQNGFCYGTESYSGGPAGDRMDHGLTVAEVGDGAGYPAGLPHPMAVKSAPWDVKPTRSKRLEADFDLAAPGTREALLAMFDRNNTNNIAAQGYGGIFFYDDATGTAHGYAPLSWVVMYAADGLAHVSIPMREVETRSRFNDANHPNCTGAYLADNVDPATCQPNVDATHPAWGGGDCAATTGSRTCSPGEAPASTNGYWLIAELEQIYSADFQATLCVVYPGNDPVTSKPNVDAQGFYDQPTNSCKTAKWNPNDSTNGLPLGDWCAKTNSPATADCHDAWQGRTFQVFAGAKIQLDGAGAPKTCPLQP